MIPKNVIFLIDREPRKNDFIDLHLRKGREELPDIYQCLPSDEAESVLCYWEEFHSDISYRTFGEFYSKEIFCENLLKIEISLKQFIQIICDRAFLFLHDADQMKDSSYPSLTDICHLCDIDKKWDAKKIETVQQQGFVPTYAHKKQYDYLQSQVCDLERCIQLRKEYIKRKRVDDVVLQLQSNEIFNSSGSQEEQKLADLFHSYLNAIVNYAYEPEYKKYVNNAIGNALPWIQTIYRYAKTAESDQPCGALCMWCLFTTYTAKLAKGNLKEYRFREADFIFV